MAVTTAALRSLHHIHQHLSELQERLDRGPKQIEAREVNIAKLATELETAREKAQQTKITVDRQQLDLKSGEQKIVDLRAKLNTAASNKEYQALLEQIAASEMANSVLSDEILEGLDKIDEDDKHIQNAGQRLQVGKQELEKIRAAVENSTASIEADIARLHRELVDAENLLPEEFVPEYRRIVGRKGADGLAVVDELICTGCGKQITLNMQSELQLSRLVFCKECGCLLYLPEA